MLQDNKTGVTGRREMKVIQGHRKMCSKVKN